MTFVCFFTKYLLIEKIFKCSLLSVIDFLNFAISLNKNIKLLSLFALPFDFDKSLIDHYKVNEKSKSNLKFDFLYYKNAESSDRTYVDAEMERIFKKYLLQANKINL